MIDNHEDASVSGVEESVLHSGPGAGVHRHRWNQSQCGSLRSTAGARCGATCCADFLQLVRVDQNILLDDIPVIATLLLGDMPVLRRLHEISDKYSLYSIIFWTLDY